MTEPSSSTAEVTKKPPAKKRLKAPKEPSELAPTNPPVPRSNVADELVLSSTTTKPKLPVSKSGLPRPQVYVEIITKKRKTGKMGSPSAVEKETKQQGAGRFSTLSPMPVLNEDQNP